MLFKYALSIWPSKDLRRSSLDGITRIGRVTGGVVCSAPLKLSRYDWIRESVLTILVSLVPFGGPRRRGSSSSYNEAGTDSGEAVVGGSRAIRREASASVAQPEVDTGSASFLTLGHLVSSTAYLHASIAGRPFVVRLHIFFYSIGKASCRPIGDGEWGSDQRWGKGLRLAHASFNVQSRGRKSCITCGG